MKRDLIIIGGGAAGLVSGIIASRGGKSVVILEKGKKVAKKLYASGNGKCNIGNAKVDKDNYFCNDKEFIDTILTNVKLENIYQFFHSIGLEIIKGDNDNRLFPMAKSASVVVELLLCELKRYNVTIEYEQNIISFKKSKQRYEVITDTKKYISKHLIIATGSPASPNLGGNSNMLNILLDMGYDITPPLPALVPLKSSFKWLKSLAGLKIDAKSTAYIDGVESISIRGDLLFTEYGVSGLAILDISLYITKALSEYSYIKLSIDLLPNYSKKQLFNILQNRIDKNRNLTIDIWLKGVLHPKLANVISHLVSKEVLNESNLNRKLLNRIVYQIKHFDIDIEDTRGFKYAEVAIGGIKTYQIDPKNMESKIDKDLYFCGEIIDITGKRGGYNLHFAWCSAIVASSHIAKKC